VDYEERLYLFLFQGGPLPGDFAVVAELVGEVLHQEVAQVDAFHLYEVAQLELRELLCLFAEGLYLLLPSLLLAAHLQLVVHILDGVSGFE
jgi:hypothetical protein